MSTIVTQSQMPWWGTLATGVLEKLLDNMITDSRQNNQTAKQNALLLEANKINDVNAQTSGFSGNAFNSGTNNLLGDIVNANAPTLADNQAGYNFSNLNNAYQQAGYNNLNYGTPAVNNGLSLNKIMQALANDPTRFRSVNMADMAKLAEPYVAEAQALRDKTELENLANTVYQDEKFNPEQALILAMRGLIKPDVLHELMSQNTMTPYQRAELDYRNAKLAQDAQQFDANLRYNYYNTNTGNAFNYARLGQDAEQFNAAHELNKRKADADETDIKVTNDGETYRVNKRTGEATPVKDPETGKTLTQAVKTEEPKSAVEEIKTLLQARQEAIERYNNTSQQMHEEGTFNTSSSQNILKDLYSDIWKYDWDINELRASYSNNPRLKNIRHSLLQRAVDYGLELPAGVDASLYTRAEGTAKEAQAASQANAKGAVKVTSEGDVSQQKAQTPTTATRGDPVAAYQKQLHMQAQANADANKPISSVNGQQPASTDVTGGNPNGTTSSVNNNSAAKVTPPDDLIYDSINNRGKKAISSATYDNLYAMAQNGELKAQGINSVQELLNNMRAFGIRVVKN
ncbi:MAG: hypothetical protein II870_04570 [Synergistaceae bacterium]|nr:hypothetical protein [Synergistaceae bacterium]